MLKTAVVEKISTYILWSVSLVLFFVQSCHFLDNGAEYGGAGRAEDDNIIWRTRSAYRITKAGDTF